MSANCQQYQLQTPCSEKNTVRKLCLAQITTFACFYFKRCPIATVSRALLEQIANEEPPAELPENACDLLEAADFILQSAPDTRRETSERLLGDMTVDGFFDPEDGEIHPVPRFDCANEQREYLRRQLQRAEHIRELVHTKLDTLEQEGSVEHPPNTTSSVPSSGSHSDTALQGRGNQAHMSHSQTHSCVATQTSSRIPRCEGLYVLNPAVSDFIDLTRNQKAGNEESPSQTCDVDPTCQQRMGNGATSQRKHTRRKAHAERFNLYPVPRRNHQKAQGNNVHSKQQGLYTGFTQHNVQPNEPFSYSIWRNAFSSSLRAPVNPGCVFSIGSDVERVYSSPCGSSVLRETRQETTAKQPAPHNHGSHLVHQFPISVLNFQVQESQIFPRPDGHWNRQGHLQFSNVLHSMPPNTFFF